MWGNRALMFLLAACVLPGCGLLRTRNAPLPVPAAAGAELARLDCESLSLRRARLGLSLRVTNPSSVPVRVEKVAFEVELNGQRLAPVSLEPEELVGPRGSAELKVPLALDFVRLGDSLFIAVSRGEVDVRAAGEVRVATPFAAQAAPFEATARMAVVRRSDQPGRSAAPLVP